MCVRQLCALVPVLLCARLLCALSSLVRCSAEWRLFVAWLVRCALAGHGGVVVVATPLLLSPRRVPSPLDVGKLEAAALRRSPAASVACVRDAAFAFVVESCLLVVGDHASMLMCVCGGSRVGVCQPIRVEFNSCPYYPKTFAGRCPARGLGHPDRLPRHVCGHHGLGVLPADALSQSRARAASHAKQTGPSHAAHLRKEHLKMSAMRRRKRFSTN